MTTQTIIHLTPEELADIIEKSVKKAMASRPITRQEAAYLLGKSTDTIARMERRGTIKKSEPYRTTAIPGERHNRLKK